ncbi:MAG TPA: hypothetical protein VHC49_04310 [Mycobacteriales bacterium]|nr:hypothetical protein [Mycobacteriales bacterium]
MRSRPGLIVAALLLACGLAACKPDQPAPEHGTVTGHLYLGGGPAGPPDKYGHPTPRRIAGTVTVFTRAGRPLHQVRIGEHDSYTFRLPPGRYLLNSGTTVWNPRIACRAAPVTIRADRTAHVPVFTGCSYK